MAVSNPAPVAVVAIGGNSLITDNKHPDIVPPMGCSASNDAQHR